jgi:hypothetical protein
MGFMHQHQKKKKKIFEQETIEISPTQTNKMKLTRIKPTQNQLKKIKVNELVKRMRLLRAHTFILHELRCQMPTFMGQKKKQEQLCDPTKMSEIFRMVHKKHNLPPGDFPEIRKFLSTVRRKRHACNPLCLSTFVIRRLRRLRLRRRLRFPFVFVV